MKHLVLFVGAGFSVPFGLPMLNGFFEFANRDGVLDDEERRFLNGLQKEAVAAYALIQGRSENLEHALSLAVMREELSETSTSSQSLVRLRRILAKSLCHYQADLSMEKVGKRLQNLVGDMETLVETKLTIITTNYDLSLEMGLHWLGASPFLPNVSQFQSRTNGSRKGLYSPSPGTHTLCKLHGSLNWSLDDSGQVIAFDELDHGKQVTHRLSTAKQKVIAERTETLVWPTALQGMLPDNPLIVPPTLFKGEISRHVREAWTTARKAIADSDYLALIGYSFPDSDTYMKYFFASALAARPRPKPVKFVDPNASSIIERLGAPSATSYGSHFIDGLVPIDEKWEDVSRSRLLA